MRGLVAVVWAILTLPKPAQPYGWAALGALFIFGMWMLKNGKIHDGIDCRCKWCRAQEDSHDQRKKDDELLAARAICAGQRVPRHRRPGSQKGAEEY